MTKAQIREENKAHVQKYLDEGGTITVVDPAHSHIPARLRFSKHCGRTNCFGIRV